MRGIISDLAIGVQAVKVARKARKHGATGVTVAPVKTIPIIDFGYWSWTIEADLNFSKETRKAVKAVFYGLDEKVQRFLTIPPKENGDWLKRVQLWQVVLKPTLAPEQYSEAMLTIINWAIRCKKYRRNCAVTIEN